MTLRVAVLQHEPETTLGALEPLLAPVAYEILDTRAPLPDPASFDGAIVLGGSLSAYDPALVDARRWIQRAVLSGRPALGICLGGQLLASALGGVVGPSPQPEIGVHEIFLTDAGVRDALFSGVPNRCRVFGWHEDAFTLPRGAVPLAGSIGCAFEAFRYGVGTYALQFHPEVRVADLARWQRVPAYIEQLERVGGDWGLIASELHRATVELEVLTRQLAARWLQLLQGVAHPSVRKAAGF
jgi:GMP synthase (glutamine-hydrolysing)